MPRSAACATVVATCGTVLIAVAPPVTLFLTGVVSLTAPSPEQLRAWLQQPLTTGFVAALLQISAWLLWTLLAATVSRRVYHTFARRIRWRIALRLPTPLQGLAAAFFGATAVTTAAVPAIAHATSAADTVSPDPLPPTVDETVEEQGTREPATPTYTVRRGDTLSAIADRFLDDPDRWREIYVLNRGTQYPHIGGSLKDPNLIRPGWTLDLPAVHTTPPETPDKQTPTSPSTSDTPPSDTCVAPSPTPTTPPHHTPSPAPSAAAADPSTTPPPDDNFSAPSTGWIRITGGAMGAGLAAAVIYAVTRARQRGGHRHQRPPVTSPPLPDTRLASPLAASTRLRQGMRHAAPQPQDDPPEHRAAAGTDTSVDATPSVSPRKPSGADLAGAGILPVTVGLGLDGPAAPDAARALLIATLTAGDDMPDGQGRVIIPASSLTTLLGAAAVDLHPMPRLTVAPTFAVALTLLEEEIIRRSRIVADQQAATVDALREEELLSEPLPQLLLIADVPDQPWHTRLATAVRLGRNVDIGVALIGAWPAGTTLTVSADGTTEGGDGERLAVLDPTATTTILTTLAQAHGDAAPSTDRSTPAIRPQPQPATPVTDVQAADEPETRNPAPDPPAPRNEAATDPSDATRPTESTSVRRVHARVLGTPAILGPDGDPVRGLRAKSLELFVYLVVHRDGAALDDIMEAIWPDVTVSRAAERLSTCVANLRSVIRSIAHTNTPPTATAAKIEPVINTGGRYHLNPTLLQVDWWTVEDAYTRLATAADDASRLALLQTAIAVTSGGLADGSDYEWIDTDREHTRRRLVKMYAHAAGLHADRDPAAALALYDAACALDPLSEELARRAMRTAARLGEATGVRERLAVLRRDLDDAGIAIDPATEELAATLLRDLPNS